MSCWARTHGPAQELDKHNSAALPKRQFRSAATSAARSRRGKARTVGVTPRPRARRPSRGDGRDKERKQPQRCTAKQRDIAQRIDGPPRRVVRLIGKEKSDSTPVDRPGAPVRQGGRQGRHENARPRRADREHDGIGLAEAHHRKDIQEGGDRDDPAADPKRPASRPISWSPATGPKRPPARPSARLSRELPVGPYCMGPDGRANSRPK
jgi:hypothetical protein